MAEFTDIPPATVHRWIGNGEAVLVDVREADELAQARLEEAVQVPMSAFDPELIPVDTRRKSSLFSPRVHEPNKWGNTWWLRAF